MNIPSDVQLKKISKFKRMSWEKFTVPFLMEDQSNLEAFLYSTLLFKFPHNERKALLNELEKKALDTEEKLSFKSLRPSTVIQTSHYYIKE
ncbi:hypothetical protein [Psychromonas sp. SP041]|uniref:hypothetical protein n=1 Tax=Psychromonas sp. SP041 TaxID=1365007 RepID=UPI00046EE029|nr:hypothetical protein [Psychromonas sp. SP041]